MAEDSEPGDGEVDEFSQACNKVYSLMHRNRSSLTATTSDVTQLSESQLAIVTPLAERGAMAVGQLAGHARVSQPTATRALKHLEARGIVLRGRVEENERTVLVRLTPLGLQAWQRASDRMRTFQRKALRQVPPERRASMVAALEELARVIDQTS
jgi:DNA-binding MarR family transcriptional regulator